MLEQGLRPFLTSLASDGKGLKRCFIEKVGTFNENNTHKVKFLYLVRIRRKQIIYGKKDNFFLVQMYYKTLFGPTG